MKLKPIRSDLELETALKRIDELWGAKPGTAKGDELDVLTLLVEKCEDEHFPIPPSDPIEAIKFLMEQNELSRGGSGTLHWRSGTGVGGAERKAQSDAADDQATARGPEDPLREPHSVSVHILRPKPSTHSWLRLLVSQGPVRTVTARSSV